MSKCGTLVFSWNDSKVLRYSLESEICPGIIDSVTCLWQKYEPWATKNNVEQMLSKKSGRYLDIAYDNKTGEAVGFYVFRVFQYGPWQVMFRGSSFSLKKVRGIGAPFLKLIIKQFKPDRLVTFTNQERVYRLLSFYGEIFPNQTKNINDKEMKVLSQLAGRRHKIENSLIVRDFYSDKHKKQGRLVRDCGTQSIFSKLGKRDALAILVRFSYK